MTTTQLQLRRDIATNIAAITPAQGEPIYDVSRKALVLGDGATAGGQCVTPFTGTWTPQLQFGGANAGMVFSSAAGTYSVMPCGGGALCFAFFDFTLSAKGSSTGAAIITGLPFASLGSSPHGGAAMFYFASLASAVVPLAYVDLGTTHVILVKSGAATASAMADTDFTNTTQITGLAIYPIAQPTG